MHRPLAILAFLLVTALLAGGTWWLAYRAAVVQVADRGAADLGSASDRLVGELSRFRLSAVRLADHPRVVALAQGTAPPDALDALFLKVADESGAFEIAFMSPDGTALASSSPGAAQHTGDGIAFARAMTGALGVSHGVTAGGDVRSFTFMAPVFGDRAPVGVVAVRIDMETVEESDWRGAPQIVFFTDEAADIFVTNRPELLLRPFGPGGFHPAQTRQVKGVPVWSGLGGPYLPRRAAYASLPLPVIDMTGHALLSTAPAERIAGLQALVVAALCLAFGALLYLVAERRRALALANATLEERVIARTDELARANTALRREVAERLEAEQALRKAQADLVQAAKLSALGQMSAGISHELNQPLMAIRSFSENAVLFLDKGRNDEARGNLGRIADLSRRMARIIKNLRAFARQETEPMTRVDIGAVVASVLELSEARLHRDAVALRWTPPPGPVMVHGGEVRLQQVVLNLLSNALDAMGDQDARRIDIAVTAAGDDVTLTLRDNGPGLHDPEKIFDPFYTTKTVGAPEEGMGLGLSISYGLVQSFGGAITGRNHPEGGAVFTVRLSAASQQVAA